jgi:DNA segregation ATPase FtsK/SpoIIIE-like protein
MSGRKRSKRSAAGRGAWWEAPWLAACILAVVAAYLGLSLTGPDVAWWTWLGGERLPNPLQTDNPGGPVGAVLAFSLRAVFGALWAWSVPVLLLAVGVAVVRRRSDAGRFWLRRILPLWLVTAAWLGQPLLPWGEAASYRLAGLAGIFLARGFHALFGLWGGRLFLSLLVLVVGGLVLRPWLGRPLATAGSLLARSLGWLGRVVGVLAAGCTRLVRHRWQAWRSSPGRRAAMRTAAPAAIGAAATTQPTDAEAAPESDPAPQRRVHWPEDQGAEGAGAYRRQAAAPAGSEPNGAPGDADGGIDYGITPAPALSGPVELPSLELLAEPDGDEPELSPHELDAAADKLEETLRSFGVEGEVKDVRPGPVVTTYEYQPAAGIRVNQIVQRANDLALAMRARSLRMEAPIPGKAAVGIEIPNSRAQTVSLREVLELEQGRPRRPLTVTLGKDVVGQPVSLDLAAQPHLLVAGSTGSGKSVCLNAMIANLLLYNEPARVRLLLIDPKMLEMSVYNGIPHLLLPVVTDPREALRAMNWMCAQMDLRYRQLSKHAVRNIEQYNEKIMRGEIHTADGEPVTEFMPYYVTIVDELADLMVQLGQDFELPVTRLAQKARAVGLHLVLATQRPSVDVLTGVIKANIPSRIAFRVIQRNDSRTILDQNGAEQLLGQGDMLYLMPGRALPIRIHGAYVGVAECERIVAHWRGYADVVETISLTAGGEGGTGVHTGEDDLFNDAVRVVVSHQSGSTSLLQRRLRIGYTRAGRLMDMMEEAGIVGPFTGSKARDVLIKPADLPELFGDEAAE